MHNNHQLQMQQKGMELQLLPS